MIAPAQPRILGTAVAQPPHRMSQATARDDLCSLLFGPAWATSPDVARPVDQLTRLFAASGVQERRLAIDARLYYGEHRSTGERMQDYIRLAHPLARTAVEGCLCAAGLDSADQITDFLVVSCTGYGSPGLDALLARDLGMPANVRRLMIGHMGCFGAIVGLRQALAAVRAQPDARVALLAVELCSLHFLNTDDHGAQTGYALFGDAAAAALLGATPGAAGPELIDSCCVADFASMDQMSWTITDQGFFMGLSRRVPVSLSRTVRPVIERLLTPYGLEARDIRHWLIHPGGPDILRVVQSAMRLTDEQLAPSRDVLSQCGNCSSTTVLIILDRILKSGSARPGDWGVMMAFGPGLTIETCLLRF